MLSQFHEVYVLGTELVFIIKVKLVQYKKRIPMYSILTIYANPWKTQYRIIFNCQYKHR